MRKSSKVFNTVVDIVICVYGRFDLLERCINSIPAAFEEIPYRLIMVDNNSPDQKQAQAFYSQYGELGKVIRLYKNIGFAAGSNKGAREGYSSKLFFLNSDVILDPGSGSQLLKNFDDPKIGAAGMFLTFPMDVNAMGLRPEGRPVGKVQHIGLETNVRGLFIHMYVGWSADNPKVLARRDCYAVTGAAMMVRRDLFQKVKGFNEIYLGGTFEDVDLCLTLRDIGYNVIVDPGAHGVHYTGASAESAKQAFPLSDNQLKFMQRWKNKLIYTELNAW